MTYLLDQYVDEFTIIERETDIMVWYLIINKIVIREKTAEILSVKAVASMLIELRTGHSNLHDDVIKWKRFPCNWPFVQVIQRSLVNSPHKGQWRGALMFSLICSWTKGWVNKWDTSDLRHYWADYDVTVMKIG